jgi:hypothetical protein
MSNDLVNQLTLNFLISKNQLQKLNKKVKENSNQIKVKEMQQYRKRITTLFNNLLDCQPPDDLLCEVKLVFDTFIDKSIYYFKAHDNSKQLENERLNKDIIHDDIDFEKEENYNVKSNTECDVAEFGVEEFDVECDTNNTVENDKDDEDEEDEDEEDEDEEDDEVDEEEENQQKCISYDNIIVKNKYTKSSHSIGVDDIQKLPLNWFENLRQNYKQNNIIPRKKELTISEQAFSDVKKKI